MVGLTLHPVFLDLMAKNTDRHSGSKIEQPERTREKQVDLSTDDLFSMWAVATKVKNSIPHGYRLENLSWRLWFSSRQQRERRMASSPAARAEEEETSSPSSGENLGVPSDRSQATDIPMMKPGLRSTCSAILAEIQHASSRPSHTANPLFSKVPDLSPMKPSRLSHDDPSLSPRSPRRPSSSNRNSTRKKKKDVDKFIRRYQPQLEKISEQSEKPPEDERNASPKNVPRPSVQAIHGFEVSSVGSSKLESSFSSLASEPEPEEIHSGDKETFSGLGTRRRNQMRSASISPSSDPPAVSLLSVLLSRRSEGRPDSCPPPVCPSPPSRPSAPVPLLSPEAIRIDVEKMTVNDSMSDSADLPHKRPTPNPNRALPDINAPSLFIW